MPINIQYIGKRPTYRDGLYGTGDWTRGEVKPVFDDTARKMLKHRDQYAEPAKTGEATEPPNGEQGDGTPKEPPKEGESIEVVGKPKEQDDKDEAEQRAQEARDAVAHMNKEALLDYATVNYRQNLDKRMSVEKVRQKVVGLIDQFGVE